MDFKNQLTKTPYLVLFIVLISVGVGTASALITITLEGNVVITENLMVDKDVTVTGNLDAAELSSEYAEVLDEFYPARVYVGGGNPELPWDFGDVYIEDDLEIDGDVDIGGKVNCPNCILGFYNVKITLAIDQNSQEIGKPECDVGDIPIGGGAIGHGVTTIRASGPSSDTPLAWETEFINQGLGSLNADFYTVCADYNPEHIP